MPAAKAVVDETAATGDTGTRGHLQRLEYTLAKPSNCLRKQDHLTLPRQSSTKLSRQAPVTLLYVELLTDSHNDLRGTNGALRTQPYNALVRNAAGTLLIEDCPFQPDEWAAAVEAEGGGVSAHVNINRLVRRYLSLARLAAPAPCTNPPTTDGSE